MEKVDEKVFFSPGDIVTLRQDIPNKPIMIVEKKSELTFKESQTKSLRGIVCFWFTESGEIQRNCFSTKDLIYIK